jgi:hypothetical protein
MVRDSTRSSVHQTPCSMLGRRSASTVLPAMSTLVGKGMSCSLRTAVGTDCAGGAGTSCTRVETGSDESQVGSDHRPYPLIAVYRKSKELEIADYCKNCGQQTPYLPAMTSYPAQCSDGSLQTSQSDCSLYFQCSGGLWNQQRCPADQVFSSQWLKCVPPQYGEGCSIAMEPQCQEGEVDWSCTHDRVPLRESTTRLQRIAATLSSASLAVGWR